MTMKTQHVDIELSEQNFIELKNDIVINLKGSLANKLQNSPDFKPCAFSFSVWEITGDYYDWRTDCDSPVAILRANQSTLEGALSYMTDKTIMVHNQNYPEQDL